MQCRAIFEATVEAMMNSLPVFPEVALPFVVTGTEFAGLRKIVDEVADAVMRESGARFEYLVGATIQLPRAALTAEEIAENAQFFSFHIRKLTEMTYGLSLSSDEVMISYQELGLFQNDPFGTIDQKSVGRLVRIACRRARKTRCDIALGLCGEQGNDPASVRFCRAVGLNYVSCAPYRIPTARLAAAQAELLTHA